MESFEKMLPPKALVLRGGNVTEVGIAVNGPCGL